MTKVAACDPGDLPRVPLPAELPPTKSAAVAVLAGTAQVPPAELDLAQLGRLLHLSAGVVRTSKRRSGVVHLFRAVGSAGGRFPLELYIAVPAATALPPGVHWYHPQEHTLVQVGPPPAGGAPTLVVTGLPWRTGWRYRERGYRHIYWDAGTMLAQLLALAESAGPALIATGPAAVGETDAAPVEFPLETAAQRAGDRAALGRPWPPGAPVPDTPQSPAATLRGRARRDWRRARHLQVARPGDPGLRR